MGEVYRARDVRLNRVVTLKVLPEALTADSQSLHRFEREARAIAALNHPNICTIHDVGEAPDRGRFIVTELLEGETLRDRLDRGPLEPGALVTIAIALTSALDAAHLKGINNLSQLSGLLVSRNTVPGYRGAKSIHAWPAASSR